MVNRVGKGMDRERVRTSRLALVAALMAALGLSACGRKGPLDPPPSALTNSQGPSGTAAQPATQRPSLGEEGNGFAPFAGGASRLSPQRAQAAPTAPPPPPKTFFLDFLLNKPKATPDHPQTQ